MDCMRSALQQPHTAGNAAAAASAVCTQTAEVWAAQGFKAAAASAMTGTQQAQHKEGAASASTEDVLLPTPSVQQIRFDEDLSTRPVWYPPLPAPVHLAPLRWWEARAQGQLQGSGVGWWCITAAAESAHPQVRVWCASVTGRVCC